MATLKKKSTGKKGKGKTAGSPKRSARDRAANNPVSAQSGLMVIGAKLAVGSNVDVGLEKSEDSPNFVRISLDNDSTIIFLHPGQSKGAIPGVPVGSFVIVKIEVAGDPGQTATIKVSKATPNIVIPVPPGGRIDESQALFVTG